MTNFTANPEIPDFTRWNRAGLDRFEYLSAGAAEFTEDLRILQLLLFAKGQHPDDFDDPAAWAKAFETGAFADGGTLRDALAALQSHSARPDMDGITAQNANRTERLLAQFQAVLTDPSAQISRAFARALHGLSQTINAYANEGTLRTATQTVHAHHLLSLIGFQPRPAASALTPIAYQIKADAGRITLDAGLAFDYALPQGGPVLTFESYNAVAAHPDLNRMQFTGHDTQQDPIPAGQDTFELSGKSAFTTAAKGDIAVLQDGTSREAVIVTLADADARLLSVTRSGYQSVSGHLQSAVVVTAPKTRWATRPRGSTWIHFNVAPTTFPNAVVQLGRGSGGDRSYHRVQEVRNRDLRVANLQSPWVFETLGAVQFSGTATAVGDDGTFEIAVPLVAEGAALPRFAASEDTAQEAYATIIEDGPGVDIDCITPFQYFIFESQVQRTTCYSRGANLGPLVDLSDNYIYLEDVKESDIATQPFVVLEHTNGALFATSVTVVSTDSFGIAIEPADSPFDTAKVVAIHCNFAGTSAVVADARSRGAVFASGDTVMQVNCPASQQDLLRPGRMVLIIGDDGAPTVQVILREVVSQSGDTITLRVDERGQDLSGLRKGFAHLFANVATFGHGKSMPPRVLGSGDGAQAGQIMLIEDPQVSTRQNSDFPGGITTDIQITVEDQIWQQIAPDVAPPSDGPYYSVVQQPEGPFTVTFHRILPTGDDNVLLSRLRIGAGLLGNDIPPYGVTNLQPKNPLVDAVTQPFAPEAGADLEGVEALRSGGKSRYALFGRALSVDDFARLAESHAAVVHAHAALLRQGRGRGGNRIRLWVAPTGGTGLTAFQSELNAMLRASSLPGTQIEIMTYHSIALRGICQIALKPGYADLFTIRTEIEDALMARFAIAARPLGQQLYTSQIGAEIEGHRAVSHVITQLDLPCADPHLTCVLDNDGAIQAARPTPDTSVHLIDVTDLTLEFDDTIAGANG
ncbi:hypothetical protein [Falsihalocynthiibacter arcticus]|uniref:Baseplate protein J-like domain-containing protein n=1 Tax=Falsihalocynthiibacter arcticus TaxID=1579316 RepID=A0A126V2J4_9RHOB|nr:hypothetical protein [Falsihalocynthiibacter arcticus]AML51919.1 hypothetical protein RC74_12160 [Falsihalocynthiibacter arcticus]